MPLTLPFQRCLLVLNLIIMGTVLSLLNILRSTGMYDLQFDSKNYDSKIHWKATFLPQILKTESVTKEFGNTGDRILEQLRFQPKVIKNRDINIYLAGIDEWNDVRLGNDEFLMNQCPFSNCKLVSNSGERDSSDAVIFKQNIQQYVTWSTDSSKILKPKNQIWIFHLLESPSNVPQNFSDYNGLINWTASYRLDSDIVTPYGKLVSNTDIPEERASYSKHSRRNQLRNQLGKAINFAKGKSKLVAWFVSHCHSKNGRELYVEELSKHTNVDVFGQCGTLKCPKSKECWNMLAKDYKFYLSFENSNCKDYITEKFFTNALRNNVIPIVMGADKSDYEKIAPHHSFIHVDDFSTPQKLAEYLDYLDQNDKKFNEYFDWKRTGQLIDTKFWCRLCAQLNQPSIRIYSDLDTWWRKDSCDNNKNLKRLKLL